MLDKSIKNIICDEINKGITTNNNINTINASIIQNQGPQNSIIFTNISNLQVNIAASMRRSSRQEKNKSESDTIIKEREREKNKKSKKKKEKKGSIQNRNRSNLITQTKPLSLKRIRKGTDMINMSIT